MSATTPTYNTRTLVAFAQQIVVEDKKPFLTAEKLHQAVAQGAENASRPLRGSSGRQLAWTKGAARKLQRKRYITKEGDAFTLTDDAYKKLQELIASVGRPANNYLEFNRKVKREFPIGQITSSTLHDMLDEKDTLIHEMEVETSELKDTLADIRENCHCQDADTEEGPVAGPLTVTPANADIFLTPRGFPIPAPLFQSSPVRRSATLPADAYPTPESLPRVQRALRRLPMSPPLSSFQQMDHHDLDDMDVDEPHAIDEAPIAAPSQAMHDAIVAENVRLSNDFSNTQKELQAQREETEQARKQARELELNYTELKRQEEEQAARCKTLMDALDAVRAEKDNVQLQCQLLRTDQVRERSEYTAALADANARICELEQSLKDVKFELQVIVALKDSVIDARNKEIQEVKEDSMVYKEYMLAGSQLVQDRTRRRSALR